VTRPEARGGPHAGALTHAAHAGLHILSFRDVFPQDTPLRAEALLDFGATAGARPVTASDPTNNSAYRPRAGRAPPPLGTTSEEPHLGLSTCEGSFDRGSDS
jgi:hypothetical protein